jgi:hypothetical protein
VSAFSARRETALAKLAVLVSLLVAFVFICFFLFLFSFLQWTCHPSSN